MRVLSQNQLPIGIRIHGQGVPCRFKGRAP